MDIKKEVEKLNDELISIRRDIHMHPELGYEEHRTARLIEDYLHECGIKTIRNSGTGVVGLLEGKGKEKVVMLRADIDALPQTEENDIEYKSKITGKMHACGHDGHTAMLLVAAKILSKMKDNLNGVVKFVFQPNEEEAGALNMVNEGVLENPKVDAAFGIHLWTPIESGFIGLSKGAVMAANEEFEIEIIGKPGHTSAPHTAIDPILPAAMIVQSIQSLQTREIDPLVPTAILIGKISGGTGRNIIANSVKIGGTIRFLDRNEEKTKKKILKRFEGIVNGICESSNVKYKLKYIPSNPSVLNNDGMVDLVKRSIIEMNGDDTAIVDYVSMAGEDFAEFTHRVPSVFYFIGAGNEKKGTNYPHHHTKFNIDEDVLKTGVELHIRNVLNYLNNY